MLILAQPNRGTSDDGPSWTSSNCHAFQIDRIKHHGGNALENLVAAGAVPPAGILSAGLSLLSALARLCRSNEASLLHPAPQ